MTDRELLEVVRRMRAEGTPMRRRQLDSFARTYFVAFPAPALRAPIALAQHLVHGAVAFAARLGFDPHHRRRAALVRKGSA